MVLNTGAYSNTGGQSSTSSFHGQDSDLSRVGSAHGGKKEVRKELGILASRSGVGAPEITLVGDGVDEHEAVPEELGVEADLERLAVVRDGHRLLGLPDVGRLARHAQLAVGEAEADRRVVLREHGDAAHDLGELVARDRDLVLEAVGHERAEVRELALDAARGQPRPLDADRDVVLRDRELHGRAGRDQPLRLREGARRDDRVGGLGRGLLERGLLDGEAVRVGRGHRQAAGLEEHEHAGEDGARVILRRGAHDVLDGAEERVARHLDGYTQSWVAAHRDACEGHSVRRDQSAELMDQRMACLAERRHALAAAAALLGEADAQVVEHAAELTLTLPTVAACNDPAYVKQQLRPPADPNAARLVEAARTLLTEASTRERVGKYAQGLELARQAAATGKTVDYPPLSAEIDLRLGVLLELDSQYAEARVALEQAYYTALAAGHHAVAIDAAVALVLVMGRRLSRPEVMPVSYTHLTLPTKRIV